MFPNRLTFVAVAVVYIMCTTAVPLLAAEHGDVTGTVTLEGKPLASGNITFYREDGQFTGCKIKDGKYQIDSVRAGRMKVTIEGKNVPDIYALEELTALVVEIEENMGHHAFAFALRERNF